MFASNSKNSLDANRPSTSINPISTFFRRAFARMNGSDDGSASINNDSERESLSGYEDGADMKMARKTQQPMENGTGTDLFI